ncbi:MAG: nickel pincer cofactor biosynthesis protein LarB [Planctomycetes bacterium]|nr:nickel pincer cofactor biosynthesis protein LarB [Planctomycetota bacterium]
MRKTYSKLDCAMVDTGRHQRCGFPEVIFCQGKTPQQIKHIAGEILKHSKVLLATRADEKAYKAIKSIARNAVYHREARCVTVTKREKMKDERGKGFILVACAGTSDIPVAEEARITAEIMGNQVKTLYDVGVAGVHRLLAHSKLLDEAKVIIVVAGMEGALPSVVGGLVSKPVVAVPTSVGYGSHFGGIAPLLTMLNSCAAGVSVVNIDNGFGAGYFASLINKVSS